MDIFKEDESVEVPRGIEESLERIGASKVRTDEPADMQCCKSQKKQHHKYGPCLNSSHLPKIKKKKKKKRCKCQQSGVVYMCDSSYGTGSLR